MAALIGKPGAGANSAAGRLLEENSHVVSVAEESLPEAVHVEHNTNFFEQSPLWPAFQRISGYDAEAFVVSGQPGESEVQAALETYKILLHSVQYDREHRTVLAFGNKELLGGWKAEYNEAETGDQPFSKREQEQVVFSAHGRTMVSALVAHAKLQDIVDLLQGILNSAFDEDFALMAVDVMFPGLSRNI